MTVSLGKRPIGFAPINMDEQDFPGLDPRWHLVQQPELGMAPWAAVCAISIVKEDGVQLAGTGWLAGPATVITAAHVIAEMNRGSSDFALQVRFPNAGVAIPVADAHMHEKYRGDVDAKFDLFDVAALRIEPAAVTPLTIAAAPQEALIEVPGYPAPAHGNLVTHEASALRPDDRRLVLHAADTKDGHSGAPVLLTDLPPPNRSVVALHIHGFKANPFDVQFPAHNVALAMDGEIVDFIRAHLAA